MLCLKHCEEKVERHRKDRPSGFRMVCRSCDNERSRRCSRNPAAKRAWDQRNKDKRYAHHAVERAIRGGDLEKSPCAECGATNVQAHHADYSKPLDVIWLCPPCHGSLHRMERLSKNNDGPLV